MVMGHLFGQSLKRTFLDPRLWAAGVVVIWTLASMPSVAWGSVRPTAELTRFGETKPLGWMLNQMQADLDGGLAGHYPEISDSVNARQFVTHTAGQPDPSGKPGWWYGEHEGYYADGLFRLSWLSGRASLMEAAVARLEEVLASQDASGYIGVYDPANRFDDQVQNDGELWTQSRMFQALLAWYEATGDEAILAAVEKATKLTVTEFEYRSYFERLNYAQDGGGVSHGVGFSDTLEWLYRLTGDDFYREAYLWLYDDYSNSNVRDDDLTPAHLSDPSRPWYSHTPHIAEAMAIPAIASAYGGSALYAQAPDQLLAKLERHSNPGGGPVGDEWVAGRAGSFEQYSEYCSMTETISSLNRLAQFRDMMATADIAERIALNSAQGARLHPAATAVSYLSSDNRSSATATVQFGDRLLYSASHATAACCSLNSTRLLPYYVEGMWLKETGRAGLIARLYGPALLDTKVEGTSVHVVEETDFPFSDHIDFSVFPDASIAFTLTLRIPEYAQQATVTAPEGMSVWRGSDRFEVSGIWTSGDHVVLDLAFSVHQLADGHGTVAQAYGPILFALPIDAVAVPGRITKAQDVVSTIQFQDTEYHAAGSIPAYLLPRHPHFDVVQQQGDLQTPWAVPPLALSGSLLAPDGSLVDVALQPLGSTVLRITGFRTDVILADGFDVD